MNGLYSNTKHNQLLIIGASGHGRVVADIAMNMGIWKEIAFLDDDEGIKSFLGLHVIGKTTDAESYQDEYDVFVAIGDNAVREQIISQLIQKGANIPLLIHPHTTIGSAVEIGVGTIIMPGTVIACNCQLGRGCIINTAATIDHDNVIEDFVHISPGVHTAGSVKIGTRTWLGIGSVVCHNVKITQDCTVGAGAVVIRDISETGTYIGVPARRISHGKIK